MLKLSNKAQTESSYGQVNRFFAGYIYYYKQLEATHMIELDRMDKLMGILALAFTWCLLAGRQHHGEAKHLPLNRHYRLAKLLFRLELDMLRRVLLNAQSKHD